MFTSTTTSSLPEQMTMGIAQNLFHIGTHCYVRVGTDANNAEIIGFVDSANGTKNIQTQDAKVIGSVVAASIDATGIDVQLNLTGFVATQEVYKGTATYNGGGTVSLASFNPKKEDYTSGAVTKFAYIDFYDDKHKQILACFYDCLSTSFRVTMQAASYVKADISMKAIDMA